MTGHVAAEEAHGSLKGYVTGFVLSVVLTAIPFWLVMAGGPMGQARVFDRPGATVAILVGFAAVQIFVHMVYFLHMNARSEGGWNLLALIFTIVLVIIALSGSLWVMYHLNTNMMPSSMPAGHMGQAAGPMGQPDMRHMP